MPGGFTAAQRYRNKKASVRRLFYCGLNVDRHQQYRAKKKLPEGSFSIRSVHPLGVEDAFFIDTLIGMRTKVVALCLNQVRWQHR